MTDTPKLWQQFLKYHTSGENGRPVYFEAQVWLRDGWTWERVVAEWHVGADILWAAEWMGIITKDEAVKLACTCVDRCACLAPDVCAMTGAVRKGDMTAAAFGACCIMGNAEGKEPEPSKDGKEPIPVAEPIEIPGAAKARYAASLLPVDKTWMAMSHSVQAKVHEARGAWCEAVKAKASKAEQQELKAAIPRVKAMEEKAHADIIRDYLRGAK